MKKILSIFIVICMLLTIFTIPGFAAARLTIAETNIIKAYQKTLETSDLQYLNRYKYPGVKFYLEGTGDISGDIKIKLLNPQYSKVYDSQQKLNKLILKGLLVATDGERLVLGNVTYDLYVKTKSSKLYAYKQASAGEMKQLTLEELSESAVAAIEKHLTSLYDEDTAYALMYPEEESEDEYSDDEDSSYVEEEDSTESEGKATLSSPVPMNQKFTWSETKDYLGDTRSGTFSLTVKGIEKISAEELEELGYQSSSDDNKVEYALVDILWEVKNASVKGTKNEHYLNYGWGPAIWGVRTPNKEHSIVGDRMYGFEGAFEETQEFKDAFILVKPGDKESFKVRGKVLLTLVKDKTNYLVVENGGIQDLEDRLMYFKLK